MDRFLVICPSGQSVACDNAILSLRVNRSSPSRASPGHRRGARARSAHAVLRRSDEGSMRRAARAHAERARRSLTRLVIRFVTIVCIPKEETAPFGRVQPMCSLLSEPVGRVSECVTRHCKHDSMSERGGLRLRLTPPQATARYHCLKQCSRCHLKKCGCGRSDMRRGASARPDLLIIDRTACGSFVCREINISKSSVS
jgi:hypothetical protein